MIHKKKISAKELTLIGTSLHQNVVTCIKALLSAAESFGYNDLDKDDKQTAEMLESHDETERISPELGRRIEKLFHSPTIQKTFDRRAEFWLLDAFDYYMKNLERFCEPEYIPSEADAVMARIRTTGIVNSELEQPITKLDPNEPDLIKFQVVDVGGQRNERKKWMHVRGQQQHRTHAHRGDGDARPLLLLI